MSWEPIATAPKGNTLIDLWCQNGGYGWRLPEAYWYAEAQEWRTLAGYRVKAPIPTHWMPLPSPPEPT